MTVRVKHKVQTSKVGMVVFFAVLFGTLMMPAIGIVGGILAGCAAFLGGYFTAMEEAWEEVERLIDKLYL